MNRKDLGNTLNCLPQHGNEGFHLIVSDLCLVFEADSGPGQNCSRMAWGPYEGGARLVITWTDNVLNSIKKGRQKFKNYCKGERAYTGTAD